MDLNPIAAYASGLSVLDARILLEHEVTDAARAQMPAAEAAALQARRRENLRRALKPHTAVVFGDRGSRDFQWLRALGNFKGKRFSVQPDEKEGAAIEALGISNFRTVSEIREPIDYAIVIRSAKDRAADACPMRRGRGRRHRILHRRFFRNRRSHRNRARSGTEKNRLGLGHRAGRPQLHGPVQPGTGAAQFRRTCSRAKRATCASSRRAEPMQSVSACRLRDAQSRSPWRRRSAMRWCWRRRTTST